MPLLPLWPFVACSRVNFTCYVVHYQIKKYFTVYHGCVTMLKIVYLEVHNFEACSVV